MFVSVLVKMGLSLSLLRIDFLLYRAQAKTLKVSSGEMEMLQQKFKDLPGSSLERLKKLHSEVFSKVNWGRLVIFFELRGSARINRGGMGTTISPSCSHSHRDSAVAI